MPLLAIEAGVAEPPAGVPAGLAVTSANAVAALSGQHARFGHLPVFAIGDRTAAALAAAGFGVARTAPDGEALGRAIATALPPGSLVLHVAGRDRRPEPARTLRRAGLDVAIWETYAAQAVPVLPDAIASALADGALDAALHYSRRSAETLARTAGEAGLSEALRSLVHVCLSEEVSRGLADLGPTEVEIADDPTEDALFAALDRVAGPDGGGRARRADRQDASDGTNSPGHASRTAADAGQDLRPDDRKDDRPTMSDTRGSDPLRRSPPTIDLKAKEVGGPGPDSGPPSPAEGASAVEPVAATSPGREPVPPATAKPDAPKADAPKAGEPKPTDSKPKPAAMGGSGPVLPAKAAEPASKAGTVPGIGQPAKPETPTGGRPAEAGRVGGMTPQAGTPKTEAAPAKPATAAASDPKPTGSATPGTAAKASAPAASATTSPAATSIPSDRVAAPNAAVSTKPDGQAGARPAEAPKTTTPSSASTGSGLGRLVGAGLLGGIVGAGLATGASHLFPTGPDTTLSDRLGAVERRVAALPTGNPAATLEPRLTALESGVRQAADDARAAKAGAESAAKQAADLASRPAVAAADPALGQRVDALAGRVEEGAKQGSATAEAVSALGPRVDALGPRVDALGTRVQDGFAAGTAAVGAVGASLRGVVTDLGTLKTGTAALEARSVESERRLAALSGTVGGLSTELGKLSPAAIQAGLRIVVAGRLDDALRSGAPLGPALAALAKLGIEAEALAPLQPFAETAPPSAPALAAEFKPLAEAMTAVPADPSESFVEKARRLLGKVVTVRAVGDGSGTDVPGIVAGIESALARGALADAAASWDRLPETARRSSAGWADRLKGRVAAEAAARRIGTRSLTALDAATR